MSIGGASSLGYLADGGDIGNVGGVSVPVVFGLLFVLLFVWVSAISMSLPVFLIDFCWPLLLKLNWYFVMLNLLML